MGIAEKIAEKIINTHHMAVENRLCSRFLTPKSGCSICADHCPVTAITVSEKGAAIQAGCLDCGVCLSVCPNGAFRINGRDDKEIIEEIGSKVNAQHPVEGQGLKVFSITCEHGDEASNLVLSCLGRLTEALLLEPAKLGVSTIEIRQPLCKECPNKKAAPHIGRIIQQARYLYELLGIKEDCISVSSVEFRENKNSELRTPHSELRTISRRQFFGSIKNKAIEVAVAAVPGNGDGGDNGKHELFRDAIQNKPENAKRAMLLRSIEDISREGRGEGAGHQDKRAGNVQVPAGESIIAELEVSADCTACGVCVALCPAGAIKKEWSESGFRLSYIPSLCTNCGVCKEVCMPKAIKIKGSASLNMLLEEKERELFSSLKKRCIVCRTDFIGGTSEICPLCINIHNKQQAAIKNLFAKGGSCERA
ncbi:MAG: 4Fe-4S dicluster domain-containing protein [Nitrospirota bacterium]